MIQAIKGTRDILPGEAGVWQAIEGKARQIFGCYGYREIRTPLIEETPLFLRSIGSTTDIVQKEMYTFSDRAKRSITLRPEATAGVVRAYIENALDKKEGFAKLYYIGPMFRAERPQAGRQRQFHQIGVEALGSAGAFLDAEVISLLERFLKTAGLSDFVLHLSSIGCAKDRKAYAALLAKELSKEKNLLCQDCKRRLETNPLRILDCKLEPCRAASRKVPKLLDNICGDCGGHFLKVRQGLDDIGISYEVNPYIVRGLDYYTRTAFEVTCAGLGAQDAVAAGGRYDTLVKELGGPDIGAVGFAIGVERLVMALDKTTDRRPRDHADLKIYIATMGEEAQRKGFLLLDTLRKKGIVADMDYEGKSLKAQMRSADKLAAEYTAIIGEDELKNNTVTLRNMQTKEQETMGFEDVPNALLR